MATSQEALLRIDTQANIVTVITTSGRVVLGLQDEAAGTDFFANMPSTGFAIVLPARNGPWNSTDRHHDILIDFIVYFSATGDTSPDFTAFEDIWTAIKNKLAQNDSTTWPHAKPYEFEVSGPEPRSDLKPMVFMYTFNLKFHYGAGTA